MGSVHGQEEYRIGDPIGDLVNIQLEILEMSCAYVTKVSTLITLTTMATTMDNVVSIPDDAIAFGEDTTATTVVVVTKINKYPKLTSTNKRAEGALFSGPIRLVVDKIDLTRVDVKSYLTSFSLPQELTFHRQ